MSQENQSVCSVPPEILECHEYDFINELNAVNDLYFANRPEFNSSEHESSVENLESDNDEDDVASDFIEPSEQDTLEYVKQHQFKLETCAVKHFMGSHSVK